jgi:acyl-coenzyme A synthetase/AMP-(fatty) acid ligase
MNYQKAYDHSIQDPAGFWREQAKQIQWFAEPSEILSRNSDGTYQWFSGGKLNTCYLALDFQVEQGRGDQLALIYDSPVTDTETSFTYRQLLERVARFAGALHDLGVRKADTVVIYMPMIPEAIIAMLACARLGAVHSVVFGGFAAHELAIRIDDARPKVLITASAGKEVQRVIDYPSIVDDALQQAQHPPEHCVVLQRPFHVSQLQTRPGLDWAQINEEAAPIDWTEVDATDPLYILYTSGTTGTPKGVVRDNGGHAVAMQYSMEAVYDVQPGEVFWAASDVGWVVGHSYIVYAPLIRGCTTVLYEGKPVRTPDAGAFWRVVAQHDVRVMFTAPTAIRAIKREDPAGKLAAQHDTSGLRYLFLAGERCDVATLHWAQQLLQVPVIDHWWQTESGWPMVANSAGLELLPIKPGSSTKPVCGYDLHAFDFEGNDVPPGKEGSLAVRLPLPPGCLTTLWNNPERFQNAYFRTYDGFYLCGDGGYLDDEGYVYITGRLDDVINVAGHRLSTATLEEVVAAHPAVAECAVIGAADELKGQIPMAFVVLKAGVGTEPHTVEREIVEMVRKQLGHIATLKRVHVVNQLPKTRSGKILRRTIRCLVEGESFQTPSTIENPTALDEMSATLRAAAESESRAPEQPAS